MPSNTPNQYSFSQGELSPLMGGRTDLDIHAQGVAKLLNMFSDSRGPAVSRKGFKFSYKLNGPPQAVNARIETVQQGSTFAVLMFIHIGLIVIRDVQNPIIELLSAPWTMDQIDDLYIVPLPSGKVIYIFHPNVQTYKLTDNTSPISQEIFTTSGNFIVPAGITEISICLAGGGGGGRSNPRVDVGGDGGGGSGVVKQTVSVTPSEVVPVVIGAGGAGHDIPTLPTDGGDSTFTPLTGEIRAFGGKAATSSDGGAGANGGGKGGHASIDINFRIEAGDCSATCDGETTFGGKFLPEQEAGAGGGAGGFGDGAASAGLRVDGIDAAPNTGAGGGGSGAGNGFNGLGGDGGSGLCIVGWTVPAEGFTLDPVTFIGAPITWGAGNWPSCGTYYQSRLWMGGAPNDPETFLGSKSNLPEDLTLGSLADDALSVDIENVGLIEWMAATKNLLIGTESGEYIATAETGLLKPGDIHIDQQSAYGAASVPPAKIGDQVMYVSPDRRKVRAMNYEWKENNWLSTDLTFISEHITKGKIKVLSWDQHPSNHLWAVLENGDIACLTYERTNNVYGWHLHQTEGNILSAASGFDGIKSVLVLAVERTPGDIHVETLVSDQYSFDSWAIATTITPYGSIFYAESFIHIEDLTVQVLVDGAIHPDRVVGAESAPGAGDQFPGRIYLDYGGSSVIAGLKFTPEIETLDVDGGTQSGSAVSHKKRRNEIFVKVLDSGIPIINGTRADGEFTSGNQPDDLFSGSISVPDLGWDTEAKVNIKQDLPLPLTVLSIAGEIQKNKI